LLKWFLNFVILRDRSYNLQRFEFLTDDIDLQFVKNLSTTVEIKIPNSKQQIKSNGCMNQHENNKGTSRPQTQFNSLDELITADNPVPHN
jgi:hypothetical protein